MKAIRILISSHHQGQGYPRVQQAGVCHAVVPDWTNWSSTRKQHGRPSTHTHTNIIYNLLWLYF